MKKVKLSPDLKEGIRTLNAEEKDQLLFRLLPHHSVEVEKLKLRLFNKGEAIDDNKKALYADINNAAAKYPQYFVSPLILLADIRSVQTGINRFLKISNDRISAIELELCLLRQLIGQNESLLNEEDAFSLAKLSDYLIKRIHLIEKQVTKLHEDLWIELEEEDGRLSKILKNIPGIADAFNKAGRNFSVIPFDVG